MLCILQLAIDCLLPSVCAENQNFQIVTSSPLVISAGDMSVNVVTNILNDTVFEGNKTFSLRLLTLTAQEDVDMSPVVGSVAVTTVTIIEDDTSKSDVKTGQGLMCLLINNFIILKHLIYTDCLILIFCVPGYHRLFIQMMQFYSRFMISCPNYTLHTAITHVTTVLQ